MNNTYQMKIESFNTGLDFNAQTPATKLVLESPFSKEIRILMKKGEQMKEHKAAFPIIVHVLEGRINLGIKGKPNLLEKGSIVSLEANILHDLAAHENSIIRLTIMKKDKVDRVARVAKS